jgi:threonine/homoserine/homoserine lactone efflux protein
MLTWAQVASFVAASVVLLVIPGPSVLFVVSRGVGLGRRAALATMAGNELATTCHVVAVALGAGAIVQRSAAVFAVMKLAGAAYLVWLGIGAVRHRKQLRASLSGGLAARSPRRLVGDGFLVGLGNPKTPLFLLGVLPQFVAADRGNVTAQLVALGMLFVLLAVVNDALYGLAAGSVRSWLLRRPHRAEALGGASGACMIGLGLQLAASGRTTA